MFSKLISRRLIAVALVGVTAVGLVACGDDDKSTATPDTTTTTAAAADTDTSTTPESTSPDGSTPEDTSPDVTTPKLSFDDGVSQLKDSINDAQGDTCKLFAVYSSEINVEDPTTPDQVRDAIDLTADLFTAIADAAPADQADAKAKIKSGVESMKSSMDSTDYSVESFNKGEYFNDDLQAGLQSFTTVAGTNCPKK